MTTAPQVVGRKACPQAQQTLLAGDAGDGLHGAAVGHHARDGVGLLEGHSVLSSLEGHGDDCVQEARGHRGVKHVQVLVGDAPTLEGTSELVVGSHLNSTYASN